jgi:hypothetical protein
MNVVSIKGILLSSLCVIPVELKLYSSAISQSDAESHFFPKQKNSCSCNFLKCSTNVKEYIYIYVYIYTHSYIAILGY